MSLASQFSEISFELSKRYLANVFHTISDYTLIRHLGTTVPFTASFKNSIISLGPQALALAAASPFYMITRSDQHQYFLKKLKKKIELRLAALGKFPSQFTANTIAALGSSLFRAFTGLGTFWFLRKSLGVESRSLREIIELRSLFSHLGFFCTFLACAWGLHTVKLKQGFSFHLVLDKKITFEQDLAPAAKDWMKYAGKFLIFFPLSIFEGVLLNLWVSELGASPVDVLYAYRELFMNHGVLGIYAGGFARLMSGMISQIGDCFRIALLN